MKKTRSKSWDRLTRRTISSNNTNRYITAGATNRFTSPKLLMFLQTSDPAISKSPGANRCTLENA